VGKRPTPDVFRYQDYRAFLRAYHEAKKAQRGGLSLRAFSRRVGLRSPNYLQLVIDGVRNLRPPMALRFGQACSLQGQALDYFCELVAFNQARSQQERQLHYGRIKRFARYRKVHELEVAEDTYHSHWFIPAIRELVSTHDFDESPKWIAKTLLPSITTAEVDRALRVLLELGLLVRDKKHKRLAQAEPLIETAPGLRSHHLANFHRAMMAHAAESIDRVPREEREIASLTLCLSQEKLNALKSELQQIRHDLLQRYQADADSERVVQVNFQMFPLSRKNEG
jgi:uncharacterized protein (TIGR02147 family)